MRTGNAAQRRWAMKKGRDEKGSEPMIGGKDAKHFC
jgi:hypothetical protein